MSDLNILWFGIHGICHPRNTATCRIMCVTEICVVAAQTKNTQVKLFTRIDAEFQLLLTYLIRVKFSANGTVDAAICWSEDYKQEKPECRNFWRKSLMKQFYIPEKNVSTL